MDIYYKCTKIYKDANEDVKNMIMNISKLQHSEGCLRLVDLGTGNSVVLFIKLGIKSGAAKKTEFCKHRFLYNVTQVNTNMN